MYQVGINKGTVNIVSAFTMVDTTWCWQSHLTSVCVRHIITDNYKKILVEWIDLSPWLTLDQVVDLEPYG